MDQRQLPEDFKEFINFLNETKVEYLLVGGWAIGLYGNPRATKDIDFLVAVISKEDLIKNKKTSGRLRDLADAESLEGKDD